MSSEADKSEEAVSGEHKEAGGAGRCNEPGTIPPISSRAERIIWSGEPLLSKLGRWTHHENDT